MLEERLNELFKIFGLADRNAVTFGHPKMKIKWILPMIGAAAYCFEQFQPFFIYFDTEGICFFPLDLNNKYNIMGKSHISWNDMQRFVFKKGLMENEIKVELSEGKIEMKIPKSKAMNNWVRENNEYLIKNNFFFEPVKD